MDENSTLEELSNFSHKEKQIIKELMPDFARENEMKSPSAKTVQNILNFSKALTVKKSALVNTIEYLNN